MSSRHRLLGGLAVAALLALPAASADAKPRDVDVQLLGLNDFHGQLEVIPATSSSGRIQPAPGEANVPAGGVQYLAGHVRELEQENPNSLVVSAGDLIGASPLTSALFHDEPTIEAFNQIGLDLNAVGNHEFDEGAAELLRMQYGGCHPVDGCDTGHEFAGADFEFLAANVVRESDGSTLFPAYAIKKFDGVKIGFIGMTLEGTPTIVSPAGVAGLQFLDEAETANKYARILRKQHGVRAVVVLLHEGGTPTPFAGINECNVSGPITDIVERTTDQVDLFVTGHTHQPYVCEIDGRAVTSASSLGRLVTDIDLTIDRRTKDVKEVMANNEIVTREGKYSVPALAELVSYYQTLAKPLADRIIGRLTGTIPRTNLDDSLENSAGNLIADAQLAATSSATTGNAVAAFMNPGGVRADFVVNANNELTYGAAFAVQPFGNSLVTLTMTGADILTMLKQQWCGQPTGGTPPAPQVKVLLPSSTVHYTYDQSVAAEIAGKPCDGAPNPVSGLTFDGVAVDPAASYRITVNSFLADGGDNFTVIRNGTDRLGGEVDTDALEKYILPSLTGDPIAPPALDRIDVVP
jgi:5'-nucleotidase